MFLWDALDLRFFPSLFLLSFFVPASLFLFLSLFLLTRSHNLSSISLFIRSSALSISHSCHTLLFVLSLLMVAHLSLFCNRLLSHFFHEWSSSLGDWGNKNLCWSFVCIQSESMKNLMHISLHRLKKNKGQYTQNPKTQYINERSTCIQKINAAI